MATYCTLRSPPVTLLWFRTSVPICVPSGVRHGSPPAGVWVSESGAACPSSVAGRTCGFVACGRARTATGGCDAEEWDERRGSVRARCGSRGTTAAPPGRQETSPKRTPKRIIAATVSRFTLLLLRGRLCGEHRATTGGDLCRQQAVHVRGPYGVLEVLSVVAQASAAAPRLADAGAVLVTPAFLRPTFSSRLASLLRSVVPHAGAGAPP